MLHYILYATGQTFLRNKEIFDLVNLKLTASGIFKNRSTRPGRRFKGHLKSTGPEEVTLLHPV